MWSTLLFALSLIPMVSLSRERERLQQILKEKKNRKWSILEALKGLLASHGTRFRRGNKERRLSGKTGGTDAESRGRERNSAMRPFYRGMYKSGISVGSPVWIAQKVASR